MPDIYINNKKRDNVEKVSFPLADESKKSATYYFSGDPNLLEEKDIIINNANKQTFTPSDGKIGYSKVTVEINDPNLLPENIAAGVTILGVTGIYNLDNIYELDIEGDEDE